MSNALGEQLTDLDVGDAITAIVDDYRYEGTVIDTARQKCELNQGFMESGYLAVYLELTRTTVEQNDLSTSHIVISAEEDAPRSWDQPVASAYDQTNEETTARLGEVTTIETSENSNDSG
ncbi:hypothetical protein [Halobellus marinus]|uniref:hypothetical protein n=1 Tax=Halobellus TaxID=1073986 RepID=UPI0028B1134A|nr:hypothetical protein [Halobellus sp. DFY28]